jgi:hypothetical protein
MYLNYINQEASMATVPKRLNKTMDALNHINDFVLLHTDNDKGMFYRDKLQIVSNSILYMSVEHKRHRALFLAKTRNTKLSFKARVMIAIQFILLGKTLEDLNGKKIQSPITQEFKRTTYQKAS